MKYLLLIYGKREQCDSVPAEMWQTELARYTAFTERYRVTGELLGAYGLADAVNAEFVRRVDGVPAVTDGPYPETREHLASFYLVDCESADRAREIAADLPHADEAPVEVWPILHEAAADL